MKRKVARPGRFRLSPNEEALLLKEEYERRRKLRLQQVREQERNIALQIRQDVKQRRDEQLHLLAEELKAEWQKEQEEKIKALEKLYLASLRAIGEGHRQAKENAPDPEAPAKQRERKARAERRHKEALKEQKKEKQKLQKEQTWRANARKHALKIEKERAAKIASLPPPPPHPFENIELKSMPAVKVCDRDNFAVSHHHFFEPYVDREMDIEQPDARLLAEEETQRQEGLQNEGERERREQLEKAHLRGKEALKMVRLARDREKLMKELEQMQIMDLAHRRQIVAQMPPQLFEPGYRRVEIKEEWQRELECAFEDMYTGDRKMREDLILHLDPQPLPAFSDHTQDDELDLSQEPGDVPSKMGAAQDAEPGVESEKAPEIHSKLALKKLLSKIRNQKDHWTSRSEAAPPSETETMESGTISSKERRLCESEPEDEPNRDVASETQKVPETLDQTVLAGNGVVSHSQEQTTKIEKDAERQRQMEWLEHQKEQQLALLQQIEEQKIQLEVDLLRAQMQALEREVERKQEKNAQQDQTIQMNEGDPAVNQPQEIELKLETATGTQKASSSGADDHMQVIRDYQQRLLMQNRMHKESVDEARKRLQEYQSKLKQRYPSVSAALFGSAAAGLAHLNSVSEPSLLLQGSDASQRVGQTALLLSKNVPGQELTRPAGYSELPWSLKEPLEQKDTEKRLDLDSRGCIRTTNVQVDQRPLQSPQASGSCQETEKATLVGTPATQSLECNGIPRSFMLKIQGTSAKTEPALPVRQVQFTLPAETSPKSSEPLHPYRLEPHAALEETTPLPMSLKDTPTENRVTFEQTRLPLVQPLPSAVASEAERRLKELKSGSASSSSFCDIVELRDRMLASSKSIQAQQEHLKELQGQLDEQREALLSRQRVQEDLLMRKHAQLKKQMEQQQEALNVFLQQAQQSSKCGEVTPQAREPDSFSLLATLTKEATSGSQEETKLDPMSSCTENSFLFPSGSSEHLEPFQSTWRREPKWRPLKPPLAKVRLGLDLEQHELSAIQELDTPRSSRLSATGYRESLTGDILFTSNAGELQSSDCPGESRHEETDILRITADAEEQNPSGSQLRGSWHAKWVREDGNMPEPVHSRERSLTDQSLLSYAADIGRQLALYPGSSFRPNDTVSQVALNTGRSSGPQTHAEAAAQSYLSSSTISAGSFINNEKPDRSFFNTGLPSASEQPKHFSSPMKEKANSCWNPSASSLYKQDDASEAPDAHFPFGERLHSNSEIQKIIDKYTKDLSWSLSNVSSHDRAFGLDVANIERDSPLELFQPLEPSPDLSNFSSLSEYRFSHDSKNLSKSSDLSRSHELPISSSEERSISLSFLAIEKQGNILQTKETEETKEQIEGVEAFFEPLPAKATLSELCRSVDEPLDFTATSEHATSERLRKSMENMYISPDHVQYEPLQGDEKNVNPVSPIENFRSPSLSPIEDRGSFYQLAPDCSLLKNAVGVKEDVISREESLCFVELPVASSDPKYETVTETVITNEDREMDRFQCTSCNMEEDSSLQTEGLLNSALEASSEILVSCVQNSVQQSDCVPDMLQKSGSSATHVRSFDSCLSQSNIPVWEWQTGRGIMEEPELTLTSSNDVSIAGSDLEPLNQANVRTEETELLSHRNHFEAQNSPQSRGFLPSNEEGNGSVPTQPYDCPSVAQTPKEDLCQNHEPKLMFLEFPSAPGSLQDSFLKRKKKFIEESSKRLETLKSRHQHSAKPQVKAPPQRTTKLHKPKENSNPSGAAVSCLKKVEEVKVCSAEDRKKAEIEMQQRTSRLYNNLAEVKIRKEERVKREIYAKNREKAKEFQKKTLEILRAKKTR